MKAEPKTILRFLLEHYDVIAELFETQSKEGIIAYEVLNQIVAKHESDIRTQLVEYKILSPVNDNYEIRTVYYNLIEFILSEFKPMLPETIEKYHTSIAELFRKIRENINGDKGEELFFSFLRRRWLLPVPTAGPATRLRRLPHRSVSIVWRVHSIAPTHPIPGPA